MITFIDDWIENLSQPFKDGDSLIRYQQLIDIMVSEYDYTLSNTDKTKFGTTEWYLTRNKVTDDNKELNEKYLIKHKYSLQENVDKFYLPIISKILPIK
jgi:hypothetical protein